MYAFNSPTLIEVQKLMQFLQLAGETLWLDCNPSVYGPCADDLRTVIRDLEDHYIVGIGDGSRPVCEPSPGRFVLVLRIRADVVQGWTPRKGRMFGREHIVTASRALRDRGWLRALTTA